MQRSGKRRTNAGAGATPHAPPMNYEIAEQPTLPGMEPEHVESYWELGARKYLEGFCEARIADDDLEIPKEEVDYQVRRYTNRLAGAICELVEGLMTFDFDFDFYAYERDDG